MSSPGHRCTRASNVSPSMTRTTSAGCTMRGMSVSGDGAVAIAGARTEVSPPLRLAVTGPIVAPMPSPMANVAAANTRPGQPRREDNSLV